MHGANSHPLAWRFVTFRQFERFNPSGGGNGALRKTPYRWVNVRKLCELLQPQYTVVEIKYFTALVSARPNEPDQPGRQQLYLHALRTLPGLSIHLGHFLAHEVTMPLVVPPGRRQT